MGKHNRGLTEKEKEAMGKKKVETTTVVKERAAVSRERRLALALRAVLDECEGSKEAPTVIEATALLKELGYGDLVGIPKRIAELEGQLHVAVGAGDYAAVAKLGAELDQVKAGRFPRAKKPATNGGAS